jgi:hypothetical protein
MIQAEIIGKNKRKRIEMTSTNNQLPYNVIEMQYKNFVDPSFWHPDEEYSYKNNDYVIVDGKLVPATTTLKELGLEVSNNENEFSDPGAENMSSNNNNRRIRRTTRRRSKVSSSKKKKHTVKQNNRFGFKKVFGSIRKGLKKITGRRRN